MLGLHPSVLLSLLIITLALTSSALATNFPNITYHRCYDGDTCTFTIPGVHPLFGEEISVRIAGIDTPEIKGKCLKETALAMQARNLARHMLGQARRIDLLDAERGKYFRIVARLLADGKDVGQTLIDHGMAVEYDGGTKSYDWCFSDTFDTPHSSTTEVSCTPRKKCSEMTSCEEAIQDLIRKYREKFARERRKGKKGV